MTDHDYETFVTLRLSFDSATDFLKCLRDKYKTFFSVLQLADETAVLFPVNPERTDQSPLRSPVALSDRMTGMAPFFATGSRVNKKKAFSYWVTAKIGHDLDWEELIEVTLYDLQDANIQLMRKRIQCYKTSCPAYFLFINNQTDPDNLVADINTDLSREYTWTLFNKKPWECNYKEVHKSESKEDKKVESYLKFPHVEVDFTEADQLLKELSQ